MQRLRLRYAVVLMVAFACALGTMLPAPDAQATPPGLDHGWSVKLSTTVVSSHPTITANLTICTTGTLLTNGNSGECAASVPASPSFDGVELRYTGLLTTAAAVGDRIGSITFDGEANGGIADASGQPATCGNAGVHLNPAPVAIFGAATAGNPVSMAGGTDQSDDPMQPRGAAAGSGVPMGVHNVPSVETSWLALTGLPSTAIVTRGYGVEVVPGVLQTTITLLTIVPIGEGTNQTTQVLLIGNPFAPSTTPLWRFCPPLSMTFAEYGVGAGSAGSPTILGGSVDPTPVAGGTLLTVCDATTTPSCAPIIRSVDIWVSTVNDDDGDGVPNGVDNCPTVPNPGQESTIAGGGTGIGDACAQGQGYDNVSAAAVAALAACAVPSTCKDIDGDGILNAVDNCPFTANAGQKNFDGDSRGDACEGDGTDPSVSPFTNLAGRVPGTGTGYQNGALPGITTSGSFKDFNDRCRATYTTGSTGPVTAATTCVAHGPSDVPPGPGGLAFADSNSDGVPDFLPGDPVTQQSSLPNGAQIGATTLVLATNTGSSFLDKNGSVTVDTGANAEVLSYGTRSGDTLALLSGVSVTKTHASGAVVVQPQLTVLRDHKSDSNGDGYSDASEGTPRNCGGTSCASFTTYGTAETHSCFDDGRHCGAGAIDPLLLPQAPPITSGGHTYPGNPNGPGCYTQLASHAKHLAKSDIDLDGVVTILDMAKVATWVGQPLGEATDPRWEGDIDGDGQITSLDLAAMALVFLKHVASDCQ